MVSTVNAPTGRFSGEPRRGDYGRKSNKNTPTGLEEVKLSLLAGTTIMHGIPVNTHANPELSTRRHVRQGRRARDQHADSAASLRVGGDQPGGSRPTSACTAITVAREGGCAFEKRVPQIRSSKFHSKDCKAAVSAAQGPSPGAAAAAPGLSC